MIIRVHPASLRGRTCNSKLHPCFAASASRTTIGFARFQAASDVRDYKFGPGYPVGMPMLSPMVWALFGPEDAVTCSAADEALAQVREGNTVVLPDYTSAIETLILLGANEDHANYLADVARRQPQSQTPQST
jgi:hypothetical protein